MPAPFTKLAALALSVLLPGSALAAADCSSSYANYEAEWAITRAQWDADCAGGGKPADVLIARQKAFMEECAAYYRPFLAKARLEDWNLQVYCAQGIAGEGKLSTMTGAPSRRAPTPAALAAAAEVTAKSERAKNPAGRYYGAIDAEGTEYPKNWEGLPGGIANNRNLRVYLAISHSLYVNLGMLPPVCHLDLNIVPKLSTRCAPGQERIRSITDRGCTGLIATMVITNEAGAVVKCRQDRIDEIFTGLNDNFRKTH